MLSKAQNPVCPHCYTATAMDSARTGKCTNCGANCNCKTAKGDNPAVNNRVKANIVFVCGNCHTRQSYWNGKARCQNCHTAIIH